MNQTWNILKKNSGTGETKRAVLRSLMACFLIIAAGCATLRPVDLPVETALAPADSELWTTLATARSDDWFELLNTGDEALQWRLRAMDSADRSIDLQTFLWKNDPTGLRIIRHILAAADRGVRIRILVDDTFTLNENDTIYNIDRHPNIQFRIYNPFGRRYDSMVLRQLMNLGEFTRLNHRMHNKVLVVDNRAAILGGRNLADEYFGFHPSANFRDMELLAAGPVVQSISQRFDDYWNSNWSFPVGRILDIPAPDRDLEALRVWLEENLDLKQVEDPAARHAAWLAVARSGISGEAFLLSDQPAHENPAAASELPTQLAQALITWMERADSELVLVSAYLIPTPELEDAIERAERRGVSVRILTNSLRSNNHTAAHSAYRNHIKRLVGHGADVHEMRARAKDRSIYMQTPVAEKDLGLHAKLLLIDDDLTFIGSANLDPRSLRLNTEIGILVRSTEFNRLLREKLEIDFHTRNAWHLQTDADGRLVWVADDTVLESQPAASRFQLLEDWFLGILPIEAEM